MLAVWSILQQIAPVLHADLYNFAEVYFITRGCVCVCMIYRPATWSRLTGIAALAGIRTGCTRRGAPLSGPRSGYPTPQTPTAPYGHPKVRLMSWSTRGALVVLPLYQTPL